MQEVKRKVKIVGIDDGHFSRKSKRCIVIGCVIRGCDQVDGILSTRIKVDGLDATEKIARMIAESKFKDLRYIMLDGITFGGFNIVNIKELNSVTGLPVIAVNRKKPDKKRFVESMKRLENFEERVKAVKDAGKIYRVEVREGVYLYIQKAGISLKHAREVLRISIKCSNVPEALRLAHLIASGVTLGESVGRA
jgi:endonuclease V-like protein UPF0215 family